MAIDTIAITPGSGQLLDAVALSNGTNMVDREVLVIGDPSTFGNQAGVTAKGTQASFGVGTQDLKDSGRNYVILYAQLIAGVTTEALATFTKNVGGTATTGQTAYTITSGKTFRIQALYTSILNTTTVANSCTYNVRVATSVAATSPIVASCGCSSVGAVSGQKGFSQLAVPDGTDIVQSGSLEIGVSHLENVTTASISSFTLVGYEY